MSPMISRMQLSDLVNLWSQNINTGVKVGVNKGAESNPVVIFAIGQFKQGPDVPNDLQYAVVRLGQLVVTKQ